ncbi:DUF2249 domain-containing protein [Virgibacillus soli]|uniref:DUF2249 domain-containing protein n=1 Tax=Paracerasibacillus soli TaxID=480284 RepID=UPI0035EFDDE5
MNRKYVKKLYAPSIEPKLRHPYILHSFDGLRSGEFMELKNDHDPLPLRYQLEIERRNQFVWEYVQEGPEEWQVAIGKK